MALASHLVAGLERTDPVEQGMALPSQMGDLLPGVGQGMLFQRLQARLAQAGALRDLGGTAPSAWDGVVAGEVLEIAGQVAKNPLVEFLEFVTRLFPFAEEAAGLSGRNRPRGKAGRAAVPPPGPIEEDLGQAMFRWVMDDLQSATTQDALFQPRGATSPLVLTLPRELGPGRSLDDLLGMEVRVLGKVTRVVDEGESFALLRRSALWRFSGDAIRTGLAELAQASDAGMAVPPAEVRGPSLQIVPVAIFV